MDWDDLRFVLSLGRARTLARAALDLGVNPTTVGRRLASIEEALGTRLFDRTSDGFAPTEPGQVVLKRATEMELQSLAVEREVKGLDARPAGSVTIAALDGLIDEFVIPRLPALRNLYPDLVVCAVSGLRLLDLTKQEADLAIRAAQPHHPDLIGKRLGVQAMGVYKARGFTWCGSAPIIGPPEAFDDTPFMRSLLAAFPDHRIVARTNSEGHLRRMVRSGMGLAALDCFACDRDPALERAVPEPIARYSMWLVSHVDSHRSARVRAVSRFLSDEYAAVEALMSGERGPG